MVSTTHGRSVASSTAEERVNDALNLAVHCGGTDESHHQTWVIDQMVRILAGDRYEQIIAEARAGENGPETYDWNVGIAP